MISADHITETPPDNPAGRLYHLVICAKKYGGEQGARAIANLMSIDENDKGRVLLGYSRFFQLLDEIEKKINSIPNVSPRKHLAWMPAARQSLGTFSLTGPGFSNYIQGFTDSGLAMLSVCGDHIRKHFPEGTVDDDDLTQILDDAIALIKEIKASSIEDPIKEYMLRLLQMVVDSIFDYRTNGIAGLWKGLEGIIGSQVIITKSSHAIAVQARASIYWSRVKKAIGSLVFIANTAQGIEYLLDKSIPLVTDLLPAASTINNQPDDSTSNHEKDATHRPPDQPKDPA